MSDEREEARAPAYLIDMTVQPARGYPNFDEAEGIREALCEAAKLIADLEHVDEVRVQVGTRLVASVGPKKYKELAAKVREAFNLPHLAEAIERDHTVGAELWKLWVELANKVDREDKAP